MPRRPWALAADFSLEVGCESVLRLRLITARRPSRVKFMWNVPFFSPFLAWNFGEILRFGLPNPGNVARGKFHTKISRQSSRHLWQRKTEKHFTPHFCTGQLLWDWSLRLNALFLGGGGVVHAWNGYHLSFWRFFPCFTVFLLQNWPFSL